MSEMTELERITTAKAAVAQIPGGEIWIEELLIRGRPDGTIQGGHAVYAYRAADAFGGKTPPQTMAPFPITIAAGESAFTAVVAEINAGALDTIASLTAERDALAARVAELELPE